MESLDKILGLLRDARWHDIEEIRKKSSLPSDKLNEILSFFQEQGFIHKENKTLRITPTGLKFLGLPEKN